MPDTTPELGIPYVLPTDHPLEYPGHSQQLAQRIEAELLAFSAWTVAGAWVPYGLGFQGPIMYRVGRGLIVAGAVRPSAPVVIGAGQYVSIGNISPHIPAELNYIGGLAFPAGTGDALQIGIAVQANGDLNLYGGDGITFAVNGLVAVDGFVFCE